VIVWAEKWSEVEDYKLTVLNGSADLIFDVTIHIPLSPPISCGLEGRMLPGASTMFKISRAVDECTPVFKCIQAPANIDRTSRS
jgi:hypothetical protein